MSLCLFVTFPTVAVPFDAAARDGVARLLAGTPGITGALVHTPASARDPYLDDGAPPALVVQAYFADIAMLEAAAGCAGPLQALADLASRHGAPASQQAMLVRRFPVPDPVFRTAAGAAHCTYLVAYEGEAEDLHAWHRHYIAHHPPIMAKFPGIRQIEIATRIDWISALPFTQVSHMQRNKVVFDSPAALDAALNSPVRHEMRADFHRFPKFTGGNMHYPMLTRVAGPA